MHSHSFYPPLQRFHHQRCINAAPTLAQSQQDLLASFQLRYHQLETDITHALANETDPNILAGQGDDFDDFVAQVFQVSVDKCTDPTRDILTWLFHRTKTYLMQMNSRHFA